MFLSLLHERKARYFDLCASFFNVLINGVVATFELASTVYSGNGQMLSLMLPRSTCVGWCYAHFMDKETETQWFVTELPCIRIQVQVFLAWAPWLFPPSHNATQSVKPPRSFLTLLLLPSSLQDWEMMLILVQERLEGVSPIPQQHRGLFKWKPTGSEGWFFTCFAGELAWICV